MASRARPVAGMLSRSLRFMTTSQQTRPLSTRIPTISALQSMGNGQPQNRLHQQCTYATAETPKIPSLPEFDLSNKTILVTGAGRGLGLCMAQALLESGATVFAMDRLSPADRSPEFQNLEDRFKSPGIQKLHYRQIDVRDTDSLNETVKEIADSTGRMDGLITAAGIQQETAALEYSAADANRMFEVNITGTMMTAQAVARQFLRLQKEDPEKHRICSMAFIASMSATVANRGLSCSPYNASKAGVVQLGRNLASEWGQYGIRVNTISPGYIVTAMVEALFETHPERRIEWSSQSMLGRVSMPEEYRSLAVFLMGDGSTFMTGSDLRCDGGHSAW